MHSNNFGKTENSYVRIIWLHAKMDKMGCSRIMSILYTNVIRYEVFNAKFHVIMYKSFIKIQILEPKLLKHICV